MPALVDELRQLRDSRTARAARETSSLTVQMTGFDNPRSASRIAFTSYDQAGIPLPQAPVRVDGTNDFRRWFDSSPSGGVFALKTTFPVTGDASQVSGVEVEMQDSAGTRRTEREAAILKRVALNIAGSDPSGGAGIQADLKTFHQFGVYGEAVIALLTVQNTRTVSRAEAMLSGLVIEQLQAVLDDIPPHAAKTGTLGSTGVIDAVPAMASRFESRWWSIR